MENDTTSFVRFKNPALKNQAWKLIDKVHFWVHKPSFGKPFIIKRAEINKDFTYRIVVWGYYDANIEVFWKNGLGLPKSTTFDHELAFDGGKKRVVKMRVDSEEYEKLMASNSNTN